MNMDLNVEKCLVLSVNKGHRAKLANNSFSTEKYICVNGIRENRTEPYYLIQKISNEESSTTVDHLAAEANPMRMMIRGNRLYSDFKSLVADQSMIVQWSWMGSNINKTTSLLTEVAPLLLSSGHKVLIPDGN